VSGSSQIDVMSTTNIARLATTGSNTFTGFQTITGSLNVGIGTSDNTIGDLFVDTTNKTIYVGRQSSTSGDNTIFLVRNRLNTLNALYVDPGGNGKVEVTGSLEVTRGVKLGTVTGNVEVVGNLVMTTAGNGIDFSATSNGSGTSTSELLNDYEEGTWTPTLGNNATTPTYTSQWGKYTKIGRVVHLVGKVGLSNGSGGGTIVIEGLPYITADASDANQRASARPEGDFSGFGSAANFSSIMFRANGGNFTGVIANGSGASAYATYNMYSATLYFNFSVTYYV
jgi:hypothetical protein